jgi:hypothetical protein
VLPKKTESGVNLTHQVCKTFIIDTLEISPRFVSTAHEKQTHMGFLHMKIEAIMSKDQIKHLKNLLIRCEHILNLLRQLTAIIAGKTLQNSTCPQT